MAVGLQLFGDLHRDVSGVDGVVGVQQQDAAFGEPASVGAKGGGFVVKAGDVGVGHGAGGRDAVASGGQHVAGSLEPGDVRGPSHPQGCLRAVSPAGGKVGQGPAICRVNAAGGFGGQQGLVLHLVDDDGLGELGRDDGAGYFQHRLVGKEQAALGHGAHAAGEAKSAEVVQEVVGECPRGTQVIKAFAVE